MPHEPTIVLTQEQIDFYHENGYLSLDSITTQEEIDRLVGVYDHLFTTRAGREEGNQFDLASPDEEGTEAVLPQILGPRNYAPELAGTLYEANSRAIAEQLLGKSVHFSGDHAIFKPAKSGAATPWHQDEAYWNPDYNYESMSFWMPLQEATLENGCMQFIPGSHKMEVIPHRPIGGDTRIHGLETVDPIDQSKAVPCPLPPGGVTVHTSRTLHYTGANHSSIPRRAYILGFGGNNTLRTDGRRFPWNEAKHPPREDRSAQAAKSKAEKAPAS